MIAFLFPAVLKLEIGIVQIAVIIEITIRVRQSLTMLQNLSSRGQRSKARNLINEIISSQKKADRLALAIQICVFVLIVGSTIFSL